MVQLIRCVGCRVVSGLRCASFFSRGRESTRHRTPPKRGVRIRVSSIRRPTALHRCSIPQQNTEEPPATAAWEIRGGNHVLNSSPWPPAGLFNLLLLLEAHITVSRHEDITLAWPAGHNPPLAVAFGVGMARMAPRIGCFGRTSGRRRQTYV